MVTVGMVLFKDVQLLDVACPLELFKTTDGITPWLIAKTSDPVPAFKLPGITLKPDIVLQTLPSSTCCSFRADSA